MRRDGLLEGSSSEPFTQSNTMKTTVTKPVEIEVTHVRIVAPVNYGEEEMPYDFPLRKDDIWEATVNVDTGIIEGWPQGQTADVHLCVKDSGSYYLMDLAQEVALIEEDYVPHGLIPGSYGDYIILKIDASGKITNWPAKPKVSAFFPTED